MLHRRADLPDLLREVRLIGREFSCYLLAAVSPMAEAELKAALDRFVRSELVDQRGSPPSATYAFKHALVQDAAYESLLKRSGAVTGVVVSG